MPTSAPGPVPATSHQPAGATPAPAAPRLYFAAAIAALLAVAVYANSLHGRFVFDDLPAISENPDVISPERTLRDIFRDNFWGQRMDAHDTQHQSFRPLTVITFRINHILGELEPFGYHLVNVILHAAVSALVPALTALFIPEASTIDTLLAGCLFATHPIHTEAVSGLVGRAEVLAGLFYVLAILAYSAAISTVEDWRARPIFVAGIYLFLGTFCKEQAITGAAACAAYDLLLVAKCTPSRLYALLFGQPKQRQQKPGTGAKATGAGKRGPWAVQTLLRLGLLGMLTVFTLIVRLMQNKQSIEVDPKTNPANHIENVVHRVLTKLMYGALHGWLLMFPNTLCCDWSGASIPVIRSVTDPRVLQTLGFYAFVIGGLLFAYFFCTKRLAQLALVAAAAMMISSFLPASGLFMEVGFVLAERVLYLPSLGYCVVLVILARLVNGDKPLSPKSIWTHVLLVVVGLYSYRVILRNEDWRDERSLYGAGVQAAPLNAKLHHNYAYYLSMETEVKQKENHLRKAIDLYPPYISAYINLGVLLSQTNRNEEAVDTYKEGLRQHYKLPLYSTDVGLIYRNMAAAYMDMGRNHDAIEAYQGCLKHGKTRHDYCKQMISYLRSQ